MQIALASKAITALMALLAMLGVNLMFFQNQQINADIYNHIGNTFYGYLNVDNKQLDIVLSVEEKTINKNENINQNINKDEKKKEDKSIENTKNTDDKTPGSIKIKIKNEKGQEIVYDRDMGSGEVSEFDQQCIKEIVSSTVDYIENIKAKSISDGIVKHIKGFADYLSREKKGRLFKW